MSENMNISNPTTPNEACHGDSRVRLMKRPRYVWFSILIVIVGLVVFLNLTPSNQKVNSQAVRLSKVKTGELSVEVLARGTVEPKTEVEIRSPIDMAVVAETLVKPGEKVVNGTPVVKFDSKPLIETYHRSQSEYLAAVHRLAELQNNCDLLQINQLKLALERTNKDLDYKILQMQDSNSLFKSGLISRNEKDRTEYEVEMARIAVRDAELALRVAESRARKENIASALAEVQFHKTELDHAKANLSASVINAPSKGTVLAVPVAVGSVLHSGDLVLKIADMQRFRISALVDELEVGRLKVGLSAVIQSEYFGSVDLWGTIERIIPTVHDERGVASVRVLIEVADGLWEPPSGMTVDVRIKINRVDQVKTIPVEAIVQRRGENVVFVFENGHARLNKVVIGLRNEKEVEILKGLNDGDLVIISGHVFLQNGDAVVPEKQESNSGMRVDLFK